MPVMSAISKVSFVECRRFDGRRTVLAVMYEHAPGLAADLAVLDVVLRGAAAWIEADRVLFAAVGADHHAAGVGRAVAEWKVAVEIELVVAVVVVVVES